MLELKAAVTHNQEWGMGWLVCDEGVWGGVFFFNKVLQATFGIALILSE